MEKRSMSARAMIADIRAGLSDHELMQKYSISRDALQKVFSKLLHAGVISAEELDTRARPSKTASGFVSVQVDQPGPVVSPPDTPAPPPKAVTPASAKARAPAAVRLEGGIRRVYSWLQNRGKGRKPGANHPEGGASTNEDFSEVNSKRPLPVGPPSKKSFVGVLRLWLGRTLTVSAAVLFGLLVARIVAHDWLTFGAWCAGTALLFFFAVFLTEKWFPITLQYKFLAVTPLLAVTVFWAYWSGTVTGLQSRRQVTNTASNKSSAGAEKSPRQERGSVQPKDPHTVKLNGLLIEAVRKGKVDEVERLLNEGAWVNATLPCGNTALTVAINSKQPKAAKLLLQRGATCDSQLPDGTSALIFASGAGHTESARLLLEAGADPNLKDKWGQTSLWLACHKGHTETVRVLLDHKADVNSEKSDGTTPLFAAAHANKQEVVELLLERGANIDHRDKKGATALAYSSNALKPSLVKKGAKE